jgi:hypothetical protein
MQHRFLILAAIVTASPVLAADMPLLRPIRDVEVEYRTSGIPQGMMAGPMGGQTAGSDGLMTVHYTARAGRLRIDTPNGRGYAIIDTKARRMIIVMSQQHMYMELPKELAGDSDLMGGLEGANLNFRKIGTDRIAGISCTIYEASNADRKGQVCLSDDGVWLRANGNEARHNGELEAVKVTYAYQPVELFEPPANFQKMEIPTMPGMPSGMGGGPMAPRGMIPGGVPGR